MLLPAGTVLQLVDPANKVKLHSRVVGWDEGRCLLVEQPLRGKQVVQLPKGMPVIGRGISEGRIWGFEASVLLQVMQPFRVLLLSYPKKIEEQSFRAAERVRTRLSAVATPRKHDFSSLREDEEAPQAVIEDLSRGGCRFSFNFTLEPNMPVFISCELPDGRVVENLLGYVRSVKRDAGSNAYGVQFDDRSGSLQDLSRYIDLALSILAKKAGRAAPAA